ncbi:hypothetical protein BW730_15180 [Tessaracoccus aquimaris]|uniref:DUF2029 domain-containing protein n=1 Tax=Tessaracoccus aquimaris TaxID=1332264 RepID=A0A1Q2CRE4_9ACTN|nr:DUF2029 domain-containing protein [Tessaracoccus aquimaris]AQP48645.1 hypothetical protein BW730_15180 [Tessaracoccus aquimaris]
MDNALHPRLGGPMGRHARKRGFWFGPAPAVAFTAAALFTLLFLRHVPCLQSYDDNPINAYIRICYSDIQTTYLSQGFGEGVSPLGADYMAFPPLVAVAVLLTRQLASGLFGAQVAPGVDLQTQIDSSLAFFALTTVGLFFCFLVACLTLAYLGRRRDGRLSWDAMLLAASPVVFASGLISWEFLPIALSLLGLLQFAQRRTIEGGILIGIAACAGTMPIAIALAVVVASGLRAGRRAALRFAVPAVVTFALVHLPLLIDNFDRVYGFYHQEINKPTGYGSLWYFLSLIGVNVRDAGSLGFMLLMIFLGVLIAYLYVSGRRPRVGSLIAVVVFATALLGPAYPPQTGLWLLVALILSRPYRRELIAFTVTEVGYYLAIWGWLGGALTTNQSGPYLLYWLAILARSAVHLWIVIASLRDCLDPVRDPMRSPDVPDPIGGALNTAEVLPPTGEPLATSPAPA